MQTFKQLVENLIYEANTDGQGDAEEFSDTVVNLRDELLARAGRLTDTGQPLDGAEIAAILDGQR